MNYITSFKPPQIAVNVDKEKEAANEKVNVKESIKSGTDFGRQSLCHWKCNSKNDQELAIQCRDDILKLVSKKENY